MHGRKSGQLVRLPSMTDEKWNRLLRAFAADFKSGSFDSAGGDRPRGFQFEVGRMGVQAKFWVEEKAEFSHQGNSYTGWRVKLQAAYGQDNKHWSSASPSGSIELVIANEKAAAEFVVGTYMMIDMNAVAAPAPSP